MEYTSAAGSRSHSGNFIAAPEALRHPWYLECSAAYKFGNGTAQESAMLAYLTGGTWITFALQSRRFWQAVGLRSFVRQKDTAVR